METFLENYDLTIVSSREGGCEMLTTILLTFKINHDLRLTVKKKKKKKS